MNKTTLKSGEILTIREATKADASALLQHVKKVGDESDFLTFSGSEFNYSLAEEEAIIEKHRQNPNQIFLLGFVNGEVVSVMNVEASQKPRLQHIGEFGISVVKAHWGKGVGSAMIQFMIHWAKNTGLIRKINLRVVEKNTSAIHLYKKLGFEMEGRIKRDFWVNGEFQDAYCMGILIN
jgi:RimJ/RimL family protein N-acetyltransferase